MKKAFDKSSKQGDKVALRKKGLLQVMVRAIMSLYDRAKTRVRMECVY